MKSFGNVETSLPPPAGQAVPGRPEALSADWLTACLRHARVLTEPARIAGFTSARIGEGSGFAGEIVRVTLRYEPEGTQAPRTLVAKFATGHMATRALLATFAGYAREVRFYRELASGFGVGAPRCYFAHYDQGTGDTMLLLEDMAPAATRELEAGMTVAQAELLLDQLARMHARFWNRVDGLDWLALTPELIAAMRDRFLAARSRFAAERGARYPQVARISELMAVMFEGDEVMTELRRPPLTLAHNDVHVNNVLFPAADGAGRFALIDWQSIALSRHGANDVARVLGVCIGPELRRAHGRALLSHYHARLRAYGVRGYGRLALSWRVRQELTALAVVSVLVFDSLDLESRQGEQMADLMGERIESALRDARVATLVSLYVALTRFKRWLRRLFGTAQPAERG